MIKTSTDLKPCPFCGLGGCICVTEPSEPMGLDVAFVYCPHCGARGPIEDRGGSAIDRMMVEAMRKWQRRAP